MSVREIESLVWKVRAVKEEGDLCFAAVSDTCLYDTGQHTRANLAAVDREIGFDFLVHLGDIIEGNNPEEISRRLLRAEVHAYRECIGSGNLFVARGERDGWRDETFVGQLVAGIMTDEVWMEDVGKPYFYVDFPEKRTRGVFLCSHTYEYDAPHKMFEKQCLFSLEQIIWLKDEALKVPEGWQVLLFSHALPKSRFETGKDPFIYKGNSTEKVLAVLQDVKWNHHVIIPAWIAGHYHCDWEGSVGSVNHVLVGSQAPLPMQSVPVEGLRFEKERTAGTEKEDLWDVFVVNAKQRKLYGFRFGAGEDRVLSF